MASGTEDEMEMDAIYESEGRPEQGKLKERTPGVMDMASKVEEGMELDAMYESEGRPELKMLEGCTPESDGHGVQS